MKKLPFALIVLCLMAGATRAQERTREEVALIASRADSIFATYLEKSSFKEPGTIKLNDRVLKQFEKLFTTDATIFDDINAVFNPEVKEGEYPYQLKTRTRSQYIDGMLDEFTNGIIVNNKRVNMSYTDFDRGLIYAAVEREVTGITSTHRYDFYSRSGLLLTMVVRPDLSVRIQSIDPIGTPVFKIRNDEDLDGVIDERDECRRIRGIISLNGCPDSDGDGIPDKDDECPMLSGPKENKGCPPSTFTYSFVFNGGIGYNFSKSALPVQPYNNTDLGYESLDKERSKMMEIDNPDRFSGSLFLGGNICYYYGKKKNNRNKGISLGISVLNFKGDYGMKTLPMYEFRSYDGNDYYRRRVTIKEFYEEATFNIFNAPLFFRYKEKFSAKSGFEIFAGPAFTYMMITSSPRVIADFEGIYQWNEEKKRYDYLPNLTTNQNDFYVTGDMVTAHTNEQQYFEQIRNAGTLYLFELNKKLEKKTDVKDRYGLGLNAGADVFYHFSPNMAIKIGGVIMYSKLLGDNDTYKIVDKPDENQYKSVFQSNWSINYLSFGINAGLIIGI